MKRRHISLIAMTLVLATGPVAPAAEDVSAAGGGSRQRPMNPLLSKLSQSRWQHHLLMHPSPPRNSNKCGRENVYAKDAILDSLLPESPCQTADRSATVRQQ